MESPGNGGGSQGQHIHVLLQLLDLFLVGHAEPLLLVDDEQAQVLELHVLGEHPVSADDNVHKPLFQPLQGLFDIRRGLKPGHQIHPHRKVLHPLDKGIVVLLGQDGGGNQVDHLLSLLDRLEGRPESDLGLSVAHVAADQPVHDLPALHVLFCVLDGGKLVVGLLIGEHLFKFLLPDRVLPVNEALGVLAGGVKLHQLLCDLPHGRAYPGLCLSPFGPA